MTIHCDIDEAARRVVMTADGATTGAQTSRFIVDLVARRPELAGWDWIHDIRDSSGEADNRDVQSVAEAFAGAPPGPSFTIFVTEDRGFDLWAKVMDHAFLERRHLTSPTVEAAIAELDALRGR